jgi:hypothetical protein
MMPDLLDRGAEGHPQRLSGGHYLWGRAVVEEVVARVVGCRPSRSGVDGQAELAMRVERDGLASWPLNARMSCGSSVW